MNEWNDQSHALAHQAELEQQEWQEMLKEDPAFEKWLNDLEVGSELVKRAKETVSS